MEKKIISGLNYYLLQVLSVIVEKGDHVIDVSRVLTQWLAYLTLTRAKQLVCKEVRHGEESDAYGVGGPAGGNPSAVSSKCLLLW